MCCFSPLPFWEMTVGDLSSFFTSHCLFLLHQKKKLKGKKKKEKKICLPVASVNTSWNTCTPDTSSCPFPLPLADKASVLHTTHTSLLAVGKETFRIIIPTALVQFSSPSPIACRGELLHHAQQPHKYAWSNPNQWLFKFSYGTVTTSFQSWVTGQQEGTALLQAGNTNVYKVKTRPNPLLQNPLTPFSVEHCCA